MQPFGSIQRHPILVLAWALPVALLAFVLAAGIASAEGEQVEDRYDMPEFERRITMPDHVRKLCEHMSKLLHRFGRMEKTMVFCVNMDHALQVTQELNRLNADLNVNMAREPVGEWILLDAVSWIGPDGAGLAMARLADMKGYFGRCTQSLVIEKR